MQGELHARWLLEAVGYYLGFDADVVVSCTAWRGLLNVNNSPGDCERDILWQVEAVCPILGVPENPSHQVGAALCIRQGLEAAGKWDYDCLVHTAEDIVPERGAIENMIEAVQYGADYAGNRWGPHQEFLNAQFFACRTQALVPTWDACQVVGAGHIENYLRQQIGKGSVWAMEGLYRHSHDFEEWQRWMKEVR